MGLRVENDPPKPETLEIAKTELRETPEVVQQSLAELREILKNDNTIYFKDDDETLTIFLRPCKWYAKSAYELVSKTLRNSYMLYFFFTIQYMPALISTHYI